MFLGLHHPLLGVVWEKKGGTKVGNVPTKKKIGLHEQHLHIFIIPLMPYIQKLNALPNSMYNNNIITNETKK